MNCTLCNTTLQQKIDDEYFECITCKALVKDEQFYLDPNKEKNRYLTHNNDVEDSRYKQFTSPIWQHIFKYFTPAHRGLDFGSGTGPIISKVLIDENYSIAQYDPYFANRPELLKLKYDYIVACEVIEHFYQPKDEFRQFRKMLNEGGQLICMSLLYSPEIDFLNWHYRNDPTHVFIYQEATIAYITQTFGFQSYEIRNGRMIIWE